MYLIDREDQRANLTSHWTQNGLKTLCGIVLARTQPYAGNGECRRCAQIRARLLAYAAEVQP